MTIKSHTWNEEGNGRRDFIFVTAGAMGAIGTAMLAWPFIDSMNPSADVSALASVEVDLTPIEVGQRITVGWRGKPVFIDHRIAEQIALARRDDGDDLPDPEADAARAQHAEWLIVVGVCTHLGCVPLGQGPASPRGEWGGWFCPCHGSHYDTSGRIRKGPAPRNLDLPPYRFLDDGQVEIG
ncbi:MAG: ubiquinol-cytochrome c reductase iron-sulfur subunit [Proteobacteria bacterium]|nr:ubiquinol-cytochrome c reductase iron-sulfur subunit [Pseudomonadota bacterium]